MFARLLVDAELEIDTAPPDAKSVPPLSSAKNVKFVVVQARYHRISSGSVTRYSVRPKACALLAALSQEIIGVDRSSDSEVFRVTRGIG